MNAMMTERVMITNEMIEAGKSGMGGWNRRQVEAIGMKWPLTQGWKFRIIGTTVEKSKVTEFLSLKGATKRPRKIRGQSLIKSDLPFSVATGETDKRVVDSFWRWLIAQPENVRRELQEPLIFMIRKNNSSISETPKI